MGLSVSAAVAIFLSALLLATGVILGTAQDTFDSLSEAAEWEVERMADQRHTLIEIMEVDVDNRTLRLINGGSVVLETGEIDVMLNGTLVEVGTIEVVGHEGTAIWAPSEMLRIVFACDISGATIKVVAGNGVSAYWMVG